MNPQSCPNCKAPHFAFILCADDTVRCTDCIPAPPAIVDLEIDQPAPVRRLQHQRVI